MLYLPLMSVGFFSEGTYIRKGHNFNRKHQYTLIGGVRVIVVVSTNYCV